MVVAASTQSVAGAGSPLNCSERNLLATFVDVFRYPSCRKSKFQDV
jgi:hypothetical protein